MRAPLKYVVCSTGHSGTGYMARLLSSCGVPCGHEDVFNRSVLPVAGLQADSSFFAVAYLDHPLCDGATIVHLVRHPLDVIRSWYFAGTNPGNDKWARKHASWPQGKSLHALGMRWVEWNRLIERKAPKAILVQAEERLKMLPKLGLEIQGWVVDNAHYNAKVQESVPRFTFDELGPAADAVRSLAERYGYAVDFGGIDRSVDDQRLADVKVNFPGDWRRK